MLFLSADAYEPDALESDRRAANPYMSKRDVRRIAVILVILALVLWPVFLQMRQKAWKVQCIGNLSAMGQAIALYMEQHEDRFPPTHVMDLDGNPIVVNGQVNTWATLIQPYASNGTEFRCPAAKDEEAVPSENPNSIDEPLMLTYGMYTALGGRGGLVHPESTVLIAETSNHGARDTFNPIPFLDAEGQPMPYDGFLIGFDDDNFRFSENSSFVTRLAFYGSGSGMFRSDDVKGRHSGRIHVLFADGHVGFLSPQNAGVTYLDPDLTGIWSNR